jgi:hypothetical protein
LCTPPIEGARLHMPPIEGAAAQAPGSEWRRRRRSSEGATAASGAAARHRAAALERAHLASLPPGLPSCTSAPSAHPAPSIAVLFCFFVCMLLFARCFREGIPSLPRVHMTSLQPGALQHAQLSQCESLYALAGWFTCWPFFLPPQNT